MRIGNVRCVSAGGFHRMAYAEWGAPSAGRTVVCVHGLTRTGRDFDRFAGALEDRFRVVCPDVVGRGASERLRDPNGYGFTQYVNDMTVLLGRIGADRVDWVGTSMGGLIGMIMAAADGSPIDRLVLNDVGPLVSKQGLERIRAYLETDWAFDTAAAAEAHIRAVYAPFGPLSDDEWRHIFEHSVRHDEDGIWRMAFDPGIVEPMKQEPVDDVDLWPLYDKIACPVLLVRGAQSDIVTSEVAAEMRQRGPRADVIEFPECGHAPTLMPAEQIAAVREWLIG